MGDTEAVVGEGGKAQESITKHPLEHSWTFWFDNPNSANKSRQNLSWGSSLRSVYTVSTVEEFWCVYKDVFQPSRLIPGTDFHLFKANIQPKWEDPFCAKGGKWTINNRGSKSVLDTQWLHTLLALIGEQFEESDEICGVVASVRQRGDKLALWTKTASNEAAQISIGRKWKELLDIDEKIGYIVHDDAKKDKSAKNRYMV